MRTFKIIGYILVFILLTILTQVGGIIFLISLLFYPQINKSHPKSIFNAYLKIGTFILLYLLFTFTIIPYVAPYFGRVPLPVYTKDNLKPLNRFTCLLNRNYVRPELKAALVDIALQVNKSYPGSEVNYLDANFPFINSFPLIPHLSHNDGKKVDLSFYYKDTEGNEIYESPSWIGYGICEEPREGEENKPEFCDKNGYWQYSLLKKLIPQGNKHKFQLDEERTKLLTEIIAYNSSIGKIFLEPHLVKRMNITSDKIRFHGCRAVRHDDHIHIQLK